MKTCKFLFATLASLAAGAMFTACESASDETTPPSGAIFGIDAKVTNSEGTAIFRFNETGGKDTLEIDDVRAFFMLPDNRYPYEVERTNPDYDNKGIAAGAYSGGGFKMRLPETVAIDKLYPLFDEGDFDYRFADFISSGNLNISNRDVKCAVLTGFGAFKNNRHVTNFSSFAGHYGEYGHNGEIRHIYVDNDVVITASNCFVSFKKGWNVYYLPNDNKGPTTALPATNDIVWHW
ncbi:MAG: hypothetical protein LBV41_02450 [Cytophagaceae bacterium]|jgi:hypothetical protein|nr:hypothetical protein [Cytophagaceae bacterium]